MTDLILVKEQELGRSFNFSYLFGNLGAKAGFPGPAGCRIQARKR